MKKYNENITLIREVSSGANGELQPDIYYALMVIDYPRLADKERKDSRTFFDIKKGQLGLERTSEDRIYISKDYNKRKNLYRGIVMVVQVKNPKLCCIL